MQKKRDDIFKVKKLAHSTREHTDKTQKATVVLISRYNRPKGKNK